jgi:hypothetical protein
MVACGFPDVFYNDGGTPDVGIGPDVIASGDVLATDEGTQGMGNDGSPTLDAPANEGAPATDSSVDAFASDGNGTTDTGREPDAGSDGPNCNCAASAMYPTNVSCGLLVGLVCAQPEGFSTNPPCGTSADYVVCTPNGLACGATHSTRVQQCR